MRAVRVEIHNIDRFTSVVKGVPDHRIVGGIFFLIWAIEAVLLHIGAVHPEMPLAAYGFRAGDGSSCKFPHLLHTKGSLKVAVGQSNTHLGFLVVGFQQGAVFGIINVPGGDVIREGDPL